jgi:hypothetical protein
VFGTRGPGAKEKGKETETEPKDMTEHPTYELDVAEEATADDEIETNEDILKHHKSPSTFI